MRPETLVNYLAVAAGSALGGMLRYYLNESALSRLAPPFPAVTFLINLTGSFALGLFLTLAAERINLSPPMRLAVAVGFLGAYTTFSTFEFETLQLVTGRKLILAALYVMFSVSIGLAAVWGGCATARAFKKAPVAEALEG